MAVSTKCEIPKWTRKKMEIATGEAFNPIKQDTKNGISVVFTAYMLVTGALPQT
jgi:inorganic pyrophosphatase